MSVEYSIRAIDDNDRLWIKQFVREQWGSNKIVSHGQVHFADELPGFLAILNLSDGYCPAGERLGLVTYVFENGECEVITLDSRLSGIGIGSSLLTVVEDAAIQVGCTRLWLITSNDNTPAIRFYQRRGFRLAALFPGALDAARIIKPEIPIVGIDGIEIHDEIEFEKILVSIG